MSTILIADDLEQNRYMLDALLKGMGHRTLVAENGAEALEMARNTPTDLVISDILMPVMDGFEFCRRMKQDEALKDIPFVFYTATYTEPKHERFALSLGAERFITKPQEPSYLMTVVQELLGTAGHRAAKAPDESIDSEMAFLRQHNEALFHKLEKRNQDLRRLSDLHILLYRINRAIRSARSEAELLAETCRLCIDYGKLDLAWIGWAPGAGEPLRADFMAGPLAECAQDLAIPLDPALPEGQGPSATSLREARIVLCQDWTADPPVSPWGSRAEPHGLRSSVSLPVFLANRAVAVLNLYSVQPGFFVQDRLALIEEVARDLSFAIRALAKERQREEAERALAAQEMEYRAAFEQGAVGMVQVAIDGHILRVNHRACEIFDRPPEHLVGHHFYEFTHPEDQEPTSGLFQSLGKGSLDSFHVQKRYLRQDGRILWGDVSGGPVRGPNGEVLYILSAINDITNQKADEQQLRKLSKAIDQCPAVVVITDIEGSIEYVNPSFSKLTGYSREEALGKNPRILKSDAHPAETYRNLWNTILAGQVWHQELLNRKKNGEDYWEDISIAPILDEGGVITHFVAINEDITRTKQVQAELQEQLAELRRWHELTLGREGRILDLKREVNELLSRLGEGPRYPSAPAGNSTPSSGGKP
ncbi:PAS domain S-box protein [Holophaga foetida]|uniref:PAS domain S-box protein n=1 Tax=Holophaga foetida TaxID=35839 RepID=UPI0002472135|nr:PAS domain S-box protein [Holophaga foetida]